MYRFRRIFVRTMLTVAALAVVSCDQESEAPDVMGVRFATSIADLSAYMPAGARPESYPLIPFYGYKLVLPNPENWTVFVQDTADEDFVENRVYAMALTRDLGHDCGAADVAALTATFKSKYGDQFDASFTHSEPTNGHRTSPTSSFVAASKRRMLTANVSCYLQSITAVMGYIDLDRFRYRKPQEIERVLQLGLKDAREYDTRRVRE